MLHSFAESKMSRVFVIMKRQHKETNDNDDITTEDTRKPRYIQYDMSKKWNRELDKEFNTVMWLECEILMASGKKMVRVLKCSVYSKYRIRIRSSRNL